MELSINEEYRIYVAIIIKYDENYNMEGKG